MGQAKGGIKTKKRIKKQDSVVWNLSQASSVKFAASKMIDLKVLAIFITVALNIIDSQVI